MKKILFFLLLSGLFYITACKDDDMPADELEYHAHIHSPADNSTFAVGDTLQIEVEFEEHNGGTVHHINVRVFEKTSQNEVYNKPDEPHVHHTGTYTYDDDFILNVAPGTYVLEAKVWGHDDGVSEVTESVEFTVN